MLCRAMSIACRFLLIALMSALSPGSDALHAEEVNCDIWIFGQPVEIENALCWACCCSYLSGVCGWQFREEQFNAYACYKGYKSAEYGCCYEISCEELLENECKVGLSPDEILQLMGFAGFDTVSMTSGLFTESELSTRICSLKLIMPIYYIYDAYGHCLAHTVVVEGYHKVDEAMQGEVYYMDPNCSWLQYKYYSEFQWNLTCPRPQYHSETHTTRWIGGGSTASGAGGRYLRELCGLT